MTAATYTSSPTEVLSKTAFMQKHAGGVLNEQLTSEPLAWLQLQRTNMMGQLIPYLAHDAIQPLTSICNYSSGLLARNAKCRVTNGELSNVLTVINQEALRASTMIKQLCKNSPLNLEKVYLVNVNDLICKWLQLASSFLRAEQVRVTTTLSDNLPLVLASPDGLEQVVLNLIKNAAEAMQTLPSKSRSLEISTREVLGSIHIAFEDSGSWIPDSDFANLGSPFFTTKVASLGLGLWASKTILKQCGGELLLERRASQGLAVIARLQASQ